MRRFVSPLLVGIVRLRRQSGSTDEVDMPFGVKTVKISSSEGFLLSGEPTALVGANVHHDHGPLGAASFDRAEWRRVQILKEAGFNAIRTAHNPPSKAFLHACDEFITIYEPGTLKVVGMRDDQQQEVQTISTAGQPSRLRLSPSSNSLRADGQDLVFIFVEVVDHQGNLCWHADAEVQYTLNGPGSIAGIGSGNLASRESYRSNPRALFQGKSLRARHLHLETRAHQACGH